VSLRQRFDDSLAVRGGILGAAAYLSGLAIVVAAGTTGIHPAHDLWTRTDGVGYLLVYHASHLPLWQSTLQTAFVPFTALVALLLVLAGFVVTAGGEHGLVRSGQAILIGYFPLTLAATVVLLATNGAVTAVRMVPVLGLVGIVVPALCGSLGGFLAARYR
jgi:hypothetical protein